MSLGILRLMIWLEEKQGDIFQSRGKHTAVSSLQTPALHHSCCTQNPLPAPNKQLSAPKICHLHLLCAAVQISPEGQTAPLHYPLLCQPLGHLGASLAMIVRLAGRGTLSITQPNFLAVPWLLTAETHRKCCQQQ